MSHIKQFQKEFEKEAVITRKMLSIVPNDKYDWQPHPKSMTIRQLTTHIAELSLWIGMILDTNELDFAANPYEQKPINDTKQLVDFFEANLLEGRKALAEAKEETLSEMWTLRNGDTIYSTEPKIDWIRVTFNQVTHHRAQLGVFLRLLDVPIPGSYGPSADDMSF
ncbi:DinB family protein [Sediminibacterium roseum]|uniref:DinB family protein n=1 Tax=Sediminibacterium roseum TaxID=1978412 RepID=A0ABW9ZVN2_9BACT|nr:DinB family protein [Sediminibacterium roseum]NCI48921.1 DinB family protein [Sediminibacterium roseum]